MRRDDIKVTAKAICYTNYHLVDSQVVNAEFNEEEKLIDGEFLASALSCEICGDETFILGFTFEDSEKFWLI